MSKQFICSEREALSYIESKVTKLFAKRNLNLKRETMGASTKY